VKALGRANAEPARTGIAEGMAPERTAAKISSKDWIRVRCGATGALFLDEASSAFLSR